jgi:hypothetical protein
VQQTLFPCDEPCFRYPAPGDSGWQIVNRDFNFEVTNQDMVNVFETVLQKDMANGKPWQ